MRRTYNRTISSQPIEERKKGEGGREEGEMTRNIRLRNQLKRHPAQEMAGEKERRNEARKRLHFVDVAQIDLQSERFCAGTRDNGPIQAASEIFSRYSKPCPS